MKNKQGTNNANALRFRRQFITQKSSNQANSPNGLSIQTGGTNAHRDPSNQRENHRMASNGGRGGPQQVKQITNSTNTRANNPLMVKQQLSPNNLQNPK